MIEFQAAIKTPSAEDWLDAARPSRVMCIFKEVCNLINDTGQVLSLVSRTEYLGPFAIHIENTVKGNIKKFDFRQWLDPDSAVTIGRHQIAVGSLRVRIDTGMIWNPELTWPENGSEGYHRALDIVRQQVVNLAPADSLVSPILRSEFRAPHHERALSIWMSTKSSLETTSSNHWPDTCVELAGLGPGLTPAGDDFLIGLIFSLRWHLGIEFEESVILNLSRTVGSMTNSLSSAWLLAAGRLEGAFFWHRLFRAIYSNVEDEIIAVTDQVLRIGHTSGADALAGFLAHR